MNSSELEAHAGVSALATEQTDTGGLHHRRLTGDELIWLFVVGDLFVFALFFAYFGYRRTLHLHDYQAAQTALNLHYGALNSLLLLTSSWLVVTGVKAARAGLRSLSSNLIGGAMCCGLIFSAVKVFEYREKLVAGFNYATNEFFTFYYVLTGLHFAHLLCGVAVLIYFIPMLRRRRATAVDLYNLDSSAVFWHMVDLLWIVIFTLLYLLP